MKKLYFRLSGSFAASLITVGLWLATGGPGLAASTYCVATTGNDGNDGQTWATAWLTISNAIAQAADTDTIQVSNGTYLITRQIVVNKGVILRGIGGRELTTIARDSSMATSRVMQVSHAGAYVDGFTLSNGMIVASAYNVPGGVGLYLSAGTVTNCIITDNTSSNGGHYGVGAYVGGGLLTDCIIATNKQGPSTRCYGAGLGLSNGVVANCTIENNYGGGSSDGLGGGVYMISGLLTNCIIQKNTPNGTEGGGLYIKGGMASDCIIRTNTSATPSGLLLIGTGIVQNCAITANRTGLNAVELAGGILTNCTVTTNQNGGIGNYRYAENTTSLVANCIVSSNTGGIRLTDPSSTLFVRNCIISNNGTAGAGVYFVGTPASVAATFENCAIVWNGYGAASDYGCGIKMATASSTNILFRNCLIANNKGSVNSTDGGGVHMAAGILESCTIASNRAARAASCGGIQYGGGTISNCIIYNNLSSGGAVSNLAGANVMDACYYSCSPSLTNTANGNITADPLFVGSGNYHVQSKRGHWTATGWVNDAFNSPCIDNGPPGWAYDREPEPNGRRINMGYDANTEEASKSIPAGTVFCFR